MNICCEFMVCKLLICMDIIHAIFAFVALIPRPVGTPLRTPRRRAVTGSRRERRRALCCKTCLWLPGCLLAMFIKLTLIVYISCRRCRDIAFGTVTSAITLAITGKYCLLDGFTGHLSTCFPRVVFLQMSDRT